MEFIKNTVLSLSFGAWADLKSLLEATKPTQAHKTMRFPVTGFFPGTLEVTIVGKKPATPTEALAGVLNALKRRREWVSSLILIMRLERVWADSMFRSGQSESKRSWTGSPNKERKSHVPWRHTRKAKMTGWCLSEDMWKVSTRRWGSSLTWIQG